MGAFTTKKTLYGNASQIPAVAKQALYQTRTI